MSIKPGQTQAIWERIKTEAATRSAYEKKRHFPSYADYTPPEIDDLTSC